jgi:catechol 2,3-dioxygenase-like lactoylglutathione lyase family enzyme
MQKLHFDHYTIKVTDLDKSTSFYSNVLGLNQITNRTEKSHIRWFSLGEGELHVVEGSTKDIKTNIGVHLALKLSDFNSFLAHLKKHSITPHTSKATPVDFTTRADGVRQVYFQDPDGYWIEVNEAAR